MNKLQLLLSGCLALLSGGCVVVDASRHSEPRENPESARTALLKVDSEFARTSVARGVSEAFATYLAEDATYFPMNAHPISGRDAIVAFLGSGLTGETLDW